MTDHRIAEDEFGRIVEEQHKLAIHRRMHSTSVESIAGRRTAATGSGPRMRRDGMKLEVVIEDRKLQGRECLEECQIGGGLGGSCSHKTIHLRQRRGLIEGRLRKWRAGERPIGETVD